MKRPRPARPRGRYRRRRGDTIVAVPEVEPIRACDGEEVHDRERALPVHAHRYETRVEIEDLDAIVGRVHEPFDETRACGRNLGIARRIRESSRQPFLGQVQVVNVGDGSEPADDRAVFDHRIRLTEDPTIGRVAETKAELIAVRRSGGARRIPVLNDEREVVRMDELGVAVLSDRSFVRAGEPLPLRRNVRDLAVGRGEPCDGRQRIENGRVRFRRILRVEHPFHESRNIRAAETDSASRSRCSRRTSASRGRANASRRSSTSRRGKRDRTCRRRERAARASHRTARTCPPSSSRPET